MANMIDVEASVLLIWNKTSILEQIQNRERISRYISKQSQTVSSWISNDHSFVCNQLSNRREIEWVEFRTRVAFYTWEMRRGGAVEIENTNIMHACKTPFLILMFSRGRATNKHRIYCKQLSVRQSSRKYELSGHLLFEKKNEHKQICSFELNNSSRYKHNTHRSLNN